MRSGLRLIWNMRTNEFELEKPRVGVPVTPAPASPKVAQDTPTTQKQSESKKRYRKAPAAEQPVPLDQLKFLTVRQASLRFPAFSEKAIRHIIMQACAYKNYPKAGLRSNGFAECVLRPGNGKRILIDAMRMEAWITAGIATI
jgi:hypothetical protein